MLNNYLKSVIAIMLLFSLFSCDKDDKQQPVDPIPVNENEQRALSFQSYLQGKEFALDAYYADSPIDYIDTDSVVMAETDLWKYVSSWLKDDRYTFNSNGEMTIEQNQVKIPSDSTAMLTKNYLIVFDDVDGVQISFVGHEYQALDYRLVSFGNDLMILEAEWNGNKVFSRYKVVT